MFEENSEPTPERVIAAKNKALIEGLVADVDKLLSKKVSYEDIERLLDKGFIANSGEGKDIQTNIRKAFKDRSSSELEALTLKITTYKEALKNKSN